MAIPPSFSEVRAIFGPESAANKPPEAAVTSTMEPPEAAATVTIEPSWDLLPSQAQTEEDAVESLVGEWIDPAFGGDQTLGETADVAPREPAESADPLAELGEHVARILRAAHDAADEMKRRGHVEIAERRAAVDAELDRRRVEIDDRERAVEHRVQALDHREQAADEEAESIVATARGEAEQLWASMRTDAEAQLTSLLAVQESLREQLVGTSQELQRSLAALALDEG